jgi:hypothetical protein
MSTTKLPHLFTSDGTARIPSMYSNGAGDWLKLIEGIQDNALIISVFIPSELATCSRRSRKPPERVKVIKFSEQRQSMITFIPQSMFIELILTLLSKPSTINSVKIHNARWGIERQTRQEATTPICNSRKVVMLKVCYEDCLDQ